LLLEQKDEWAVQRTGSMTFESIAQTGGDDAVSLPKLPTLRSALVSVAGLTPVGQPVA
jgi:hypothetical protein